MGENAIQFTAMEKVWIDTTEARKHWDVGNESNKIAAIKAVRIEGGIGLREAKEWVESFYEDGFKSSGTEMWNIETEAYTLQDLIDKLGEIADIVGNLKERGLF